MPRWLCPTVAVRSIISAHRPRHSCQVERDTIYFYGGYLTAAQDGNELLAWLCIDDRSIERHGSGSSTAIERDHHRFNGVAAA